jgi:hypothetical protein
MGENASNHEIQRGTVFQFFNRKVYSDPSVLLSQLGAVRLDRDIRAVVGYLSSQAVFGNAREKFQRLFQVSILLNLDAVSVTIECAGKC